MLPSLSSALRRHRARRRLCPRTHASGGSHRGRTCPLCGVCAVMIRVCLYDHVGTGLLFPAPTGVSYFNQVGGVACLERELEGVFVPYANDVEVPSRRLLSLENELNAHFARIGTGAFDSSDADVVEDLMAKHPQWSGVSIDRERIRESVEAWVHVWVDGCGGVSGLGPGPHPAVLTWTNSD